MFIILIICIYILLMFMFFLFCHARILEVQNNDTVCEQKVVDENDVVCSLMQFIFVLCCRSVKWFWRWK